MDFSISLRAAESICDCQKLPLACSKAAVFVPGINRQSEKMQIRREAGAEEEGKTNTFRAPFDFTADLYLCGKLKFVKPLSLSLRKAASQKNILAGSKIIGPPF